jgi:AcrR family transcriptional regulator
MDPDSRREQLLELGVRLLSSRSLDELSIETLAEEAGISRGLLYHYFGNKLDFHRAVVRKAADDLIRVTAPVQDGEPLERLAKSLDAYVGYVVANYAGYVSLVRRADRPDLRRGRRRGPARRVRSGGHTGRAADGPRLERDG